MTKLKKFIIDYLFIYVGFGCALILYALFGIWIGLVVPDEIIEGIMLSTVFFLLPNLGFLTGLYLIAFASKITFSRVSIVLLSAIANSIFLFFSAFNVWNFWWQIVLIYLGVILIYVFIKKLMPSSLTSPTRFP